MASYRQWAGRLRQALGAWLGYPAPGGGPDIAACASACEQAWAHHGQGHTDNAIGLLKDLLARARTVGSAGAAPAAAIYCCLGQIYAADKRLEPAADALQRAVTTYQDLGDGYRSESAAALDSLAEIHLQAGRLEIALVTAERALAIYRKLEQPAKVAGGLSRMAGILAQQQRYSEAEACYADAFYAAQRAGDEALKASLLQQQGSLKGRQELHEQAGRLFEEAVAVLRQAGALEGEMQACNLLATAQVRFGDLDSAEANYTRSRALAEQLNDRAQAAICAQNLGVLYQKRAELAADGATQTTLLEQAVALVKESLATRLEMNNPVGAEAAYFQLGIMHWRLGEMDEAKRCLLQATELSETLGLTKVYKNYSVLARIAQDQGDTGEAADWQAKCDAKLSEMQKRT